MLQVQHARVDKLIKPFGACSISLCCTAKVLIAGPGPGIYVFARVVHLCTLCFDRGA